MSVITEKPVITKISDEIFTRLETLISEPNDSVTFAGVIRPTKLATHVPQHMLIVLSRGDVSRQTDLDCPGNPPAICYQQTFVIRVHIAPSERDSTPVEFYEDIAEASIIRAIRNDGSWHTFDGNAINAQFDAVQTVTADGGYDGIMIPLNVTYRIAENDPYTARA
jgi:hypothetical protein